MAAVHQGDKWGYINREGKTVIPFRRVDSASPFKEGIAVVNGNYIDKKGKVVRPIHEGKSPEGEQSVRDFAFKNGLALISAQGKWGYMDRTGKVVIKPQYQSAKHFSEGLAVVNDSENGSFYIDKTGKPISSNRFDDCGEFQNGAGLVKISGKMGYINAAGKYIYTPNEASKMPSR
jgi:WG containing repeat